jgi:hypothetical protein
MLIRLLEKSRQWWSKKYGRELTLADAAEIHRNLFGFFRLLTKLDARQRKIAAGQRVVDEQKVRKLRGDIYRLEDQLKADGQDDWPLAKGRTATLGPRTGPHCPGAAVGREAQRYQP